MGGFLVVLMLAFESMEVREGRKEANYSLYYVIRYDITGELFLAYNRLLYG